MAVNYRMSSLLCLLIVFTLGAAIAIVHGDREGHRRGRWRRRRWRASSRLVRLLLRREIAPPYRTPYLGCALAPPEAIRMPSVEANPPCAVSAGAEAAPMVDVV